jgi:tetratricopeptide (TPR) repeat protein
MPAPEVAPDLAALLAEQSAWLEAEALAAPEPTRATIFLSLSEIEATVGHTDRARSFASRARDLVPGSPLAHMQARALDAQAGTTLESEAAALIAEGACTELSAVKQHAAFLGADVLWRSGDVEGSLVMATRLAETGDVRGVIARIAWGLADADVDGLTAFVARAPAETTAPLTTLLRLRGVAVGEASAPASPDGVTDTFEAARLALARGEPIAAAKAVAELRAVPELAKGALWLASALGATSPEGRPLALGWLGELAAEGDAAARTSLAVRAVEAGDRAALVSALALGGFAPADEVALSALLGLGTSQLLPKLGDELGALAAAVGAFDAKADGENHAGVARADRVVGTDRARAERRMARLLAANAPVAELEKALAPLREARQEIADALELELALRANAYSRVSALIQKWQVDEPQAHVTDAALAAGLIAERTADPARALAAFREARMLDRSSEVALRALASLQASADLPGELNELADELGATVQGALARLEAVLREDSVDDATRAELYERAHRAAPLLPFAAFLAERIAKRTGNGEEVLHWINERSGTPTDPMLAVGDLLREARILMGRDPEGSVLRIADAHRARPGDLALREWYERTTPTSADDHAKYWEAQAREMSGDSRALLHLEIAHAYERAGDTAGVLRVVDAAGASAPLLDLARERAEADGGEAARLVDRLLTEAKNTDDDVVRREAYERLAEIDGVGRGDTGSALLWHKAILEAGHHLPSLRYVEQALIGEGRDEELEPVVASIAEVLLSSTTLPTDGGERVAHADLAARLRARGPNGDWEATFELATLATKDSVPSLASLRLLQAHARAKRDDDLLIRVSEQLLERATRPVEMAALRLRVAEAAFRENDLAQALASLEQSTNEDPGDLVAFRLLAEVRHASGDAAGAAEAHESVARLSMVQAHQLSAWYDAAELWLEDGEHQEEAMHAFEQAAALDLGHEDVFSRLSQLYAARGAHSDLAALLERRIAIAITPDERVTLEVERARALLAGGDRAAARAALDAALHDRPDHTTALATFGELSALEQDWERAEEAWVRLARLLSTPDEQRAIYERLGDLYSTKTVHLERAELAFKEVLKRVPGDTRTIERLIDVYRRQRDVGKAVEAQQELLAQVKTPAEKRDRTIELALLHEDPGHDERRAEQVLEAARREYPTDVVVLRALAEFYARHKQTPAVQILLDRAAADTRRAFAAGRFAPALFEVMHAIFDLRGQAGPARIVGASLSAIEGRPSDARGAFGAALDAKIDDLLAPDVLSPGLRALLLRAGSVLDVASPMDLRAMGAVVAGPEARTVQELVASFASGLGLVPATVYVSKTIGRTCLPVASDPPSLIVGESLLAATNERAVAFLVMRAMKLIAARASALIRTTSTDLAALVPAWLSAIAPKFTPQGLNPTALATATRKIAQAKLPPLNDEVVSLALEVAAQLGTRGSTLGGHATAWANRSALLGVGDPNAALEAIAWSLGTKDGAPEGAAARAAWIGRTHEAKDLLIFSVGDNYAEARARLHL